MSHVDLQTLASLADATHVRSRDVMHVDRCLVCRRAAAVCGISDKDMTASLAIVRSRKRRFIATGILAAGVAVAVVAAPLRGAAYSFFAFFEPHQVAAVPLTLDDMRSLRRMPDLSAYAATREVRKSIATTFTDARSAAVAAGFTLRQPTFVPTAIHGVSYTVNSPSTQLLFFGQTAHSPRPTSAVPLPADIAGSTLDIELGATVLAAYETGPGSAQQAPLAPTLQPVRPSNFTARTASATVRSGAPTAYGYGSYSGHVSIVHNDGNSRTFSIRRAVPLVVVQMRVPRIATTGVSLQRLSSFMLDQPGVSPHVVAAFRALGDLSATLPIPVPIDRAYTQPVVVDGVQGVGIGDETGIGAAVIWQRSGMLYAVFASRPAREVLAIANSLR